MRRLFVACSAVHCAAQRYMHSPFTALVLESATVDEMVVFFTNTTTLIQQLTLFPLWNAANTATTALQSLTRFLAALLTTVRCY
jgi:membrane glycosyltransferase